MDSDTNTTSLIWDIDGDRLKEPDKANKKLGDYMIILSRMLELTENEPETVEFKEEIINDLVKEG